MGTFVPLIGTLRGKIGAIVIDKTGRTRLHAPGPNRTPALVKKAFSVLAKQWPFSSTVYKGVVSNAPNVSKGIGYLTGRAYRAAAIAAEVADAMTTDAKGILPYRLSNLQGEFGEGIQLSPCVWGAEIAAGGTEIHATFDASVTIQAASARLAILLVSCEQMALGLTDNALAGVIVATPTDTNPVFTYDDTRLTTASTPGTYAIFCALYANDAVTLEPIVLSFGSGVLITT